jgi:hypothetical protein
LDKHFTEYGTLLPGVYSFSITQIRQLFGKGNPEPKREEMFENLLWFVDIAKQVDLDIIYVNGSFASKWKNPNDLEISAGYKYRTSENQLQLNKFLSEYGMAMMRRKIDFLPYVEGTNIEELFYDIKDAKERGLPSDLRKGFVLCLHE